MILIYMNRLILNRIPLNEVKLCVFDMAGTVVQENGIVYDTLYETIKYFKIPIKRFEINRWHGANKQEVLNYFLEREESNCVMERQVMYEHFDTQLKEKYFDGTDLSLMDESIPTLFESLRNKDIKIALNTGYSRDIQESILHSLDLHLMIDGYISSEDVKYGRPYPYMIYHLMEQFEVKASKQVVKFGDTPHDIKEGHNAGCIASVGVLSGVGTNVTLKSADFIVDSVVDIDV
jgi:phosphonatase-like hydrolase